MLPIGHIAAALYGSQNKHGTIGQRHGAPEHTRGEPLFGTVKPLHDMQRCQGNCDTTGELDDLLSVRLTIPGAV